MAERRVPDAEFGREVTPRRADTRSPGSSVQHPSVVAGGLAVERAGRHHEGLEVKDHSLSVSSPRIGADLHARDQRGARPRSAGKPFQFGHAAQIHAGPAIPVA